MHEREQFLLRAQVSSQDNPPAVDTAADAMGQVGIPDSSPAMPREVVECQKRAVNPRQGTASADAWPHTGMLNPEALAHAGVLHIPIHPCLAAAPTLATH